MEVPINISNLTLATRFFQQLQSLSVTGPPGFHTWPPYPERSSPGPGLSSPSCSSLYNTDIWAMPTGHFYLLASYPLGHCSWLSPFPAHLPLHGPAQPGFVHSGLSQTSLPLTMLSLMSTINFLITIPRSSQPSFYFFFSFTLQGGSWQCSV